MPTGQYDKVLAKLCPHRGIGEENSLDAIRSGIQASPFLVEFDVQWYNDDLYLGHPPEVGENTLSQALELFRDTLIIPKIDIKLSSQTNNQGLQALIDQLLNWDPKKALINIAGDLSADEYFQAEKKLMKNTEENVLLNIDLERYTGKTDSIISDHIKNLKRVPFSISPNLETSTIDTISFAKEKHIHHIHFWSYFDKKYSTNDLYDRMELCNKYGLQVYFDIKTQNISDLRL